MRWEQSFLLQWWWEKSMVVVDHLNWCLDWMTDKSLVPMASMADTMTLMVNRWQNRAVMELSNSGVVVVKPRLFYSQWVWVVEVVLLEVRMVFYVDMHNVSDVVVRLNIHCVLVGSKVTEMGHLCWGIMVSWDDWCMHIWVLTVCVVMYVMGRVAMVLWVMACIKMTCIKMASFVMAKVMMTI